MVGNVEKELYLLTRLFRLFSRRLLSASINVCSFISAIIYINFKFLFIFKLSCSLKTKANDDSVEQLSSAMSFPNKPNKVRPRSRFFSKYRIRSEVASGIHECNAERQIVLVQSYTSIIA